MRKAFDSRTDRAHALAVYLALAWVASDFVAEEFEIEKSRLVERSGVSYRKVADLLLIFVRLGLIEMSETFVEGTKERGPNLYRMLGIPCATSGTLCRRLGTNAEQTTVPRIEEEQERSLKEPLKEQRPPVADLGFKNIPPRPNPSREDIEHIYGLYPKKVAKVAALKAIGKALSRVSVDVLKCAVAEYAAAVEKWPDDEKKFVPNPATWFNAGQWEDDRNAWQRTQAGRSDLTPNQRARRAAGWGVQQPELTPSQRAVFAAWGAPTVTR